MLRVVLPLLALCSAAHASSACQPSESSKSDLRRATQIVQQLPELATREADNFLFDTGSREKIAGQCYEAVFVYSVMPSKDLDLRYVFAVHLPSKRVLAEDLPSGEFVSLKEWRARRASSTAP